MFKIIIHIVYQFLLVNTYLYIFRLVSNFINIATIVVSRFELIKFQNVSYNSYNIFITFSYGKYSNTFANRCMHNIRII